MTKTKTKSMTGGFVTGDEVEVISEEEGFAGAYFAASVARSLPIVKRYTVSHHSLLSDRGGPLRETVDARLVRPRPPSSPPPNFLLHDCVDAFHSDAWWSGVVVSPPQSASSKVVVVCFPLYREVFSFDPSQIRPHLEWLSDRWVPPSLLEMPASIYKEGSRVQVASIYKEGSRVQVAQPKDDDDDDDDDVAWSPAVVAKRIWKNNYLVHYSHFPSTKTDLPVQEIIDIQHLRLCPSHSHTTVDHPSQKKADCSVKFQKGLVVEVSSDEEGFKGAWFTATIIRPVGTRFCVEYHDLRTDDETALLQETVDPIHIRPIPPETHCGPDPLRLLEEVDAYHNDGWWAGVVSKVVGKNRYVVYFRQWKEEMEFGHDVLRPHFDWVGGRWVRLSLALEL